MQFHTAGGFMSSTSLSWRKGWLPWSCTLQTTEIPPGAVHVVVDVPVVLLDRFHRCAWSRLCSILWRLCSLSLACLFGPCTQVHGQAFPRHQGGEGVAGDAGSLLPGVLPPELVACVGASCVIHHDRTTTTTTTTQARTGCVALFVW